MGVGSALIGALRVTLGLDTAQFEAGSKRARQVSARDVAAIQKDLSKLRQGFDNLRNAAIATALAGASKRALEYASSLGEVAQQTGVTTKELQEYRYAASQVGISNEEMDKSLSKLTRTIGEAKAGSKAQATLFRDLGVSIEDANGRVYSAGEIIPKLADALSRIKDPATRARYEVDLFGKTGQKLDTLLAGGSSAVNELTDAARKLGVVLSDRQIQNADDTADKLSALQQVLEARIAGVVADNANAILTLANALATLADSAAKASAKAPGLFAALGGAAVGGRIAGAPGALLGAITGQAAVLGYYAKNDPYRVKGDNTRSLIDRLKKGAKDQRAGIRAGLTGDDAYKQLSAELDAIDAELARRLNGPKPQAAAPATVVPDGALPTFKPSGGGNGRSSPKDRTDEKLERFNKELAGLKEDELSAQQQLTTDVNDRARFEQMRLDTQQQAYEYDVDSRVKQGDLTAAQGEQLKLAKQAVLDAERRAVDEQRTADLDRQAYALTEEGLDARADQLRIDLDDARTAERRRQIGIAMLDLDIERQRELVDHLKALRDLNQATDAEVDAAEARLGTMEGQRDARVRRIGRENAGPKRAFLDSLPRDADELREKFEAIEVDALNNSLDVAAGRVVRLKGLAGDLFNQLINDVIRLNLQTALNGGGLIGSLGKLLGFARSGGGAATDSLGSLGSSLGGGIKLPGFAGTGKFRVGGISGLDRNVLAINGIPRAMVSHNENVSIGYGSGDDSPERVQIVPSPYFDAVVDDRASGVAGTMYAAGAQASARRDRWRLGGR